MRMSDMIAAQPTAPGPSMIAAAMPPVRITSATEAGISRRRVSAALTSEGGGVMDMGRAVSANTWSGRCQGMVKIG